MGQLLVSAGLLLGLGVGSGPADLERLPLEHASPGKNHPVCRGETLVDFVRKRSQCVCKPTGNPAERRGTAPSGIGEHSKESPPAAPSPVPLGVGDSVLPGGHRPRALATLCWPGAVFPSLRAPAARRGTEFTPKPQLPPVPAAPGPSGCAGNSPGGAAGPLLDGAL